MDPYNKGLRISAIIHIGMLVCVLVGISIAQLKPKPTETFTLVAGPPKGMIAGGVASPKPSESQTAPQAPKLAQPPKEQPKAQAKQEVKPLAYKTNLRPQSPPKQTPKPKPLPKPRTPKQIQPAPPKKISFADFRKESADSLDKQKAYYDKLEKKKRTQPQPKKQSYDDFASALNKRIDSLESSQGASQRKSTPGSGEYGNGTAGATQDLERIYSSTLHQYLNNLWQEPRDLGGARLSAEVEFTVDARGKIKSWKIRRGSGVSEFDRSVSAVFERTSSVPQPPKATDYRLSVTFETRNG